MNINGFADEKSDCRLYVGNLDLRITEASLIKMFSPFGKIIAEDFLWHTRGAKRGSPRGYAFVQFNTKEGHTRLHCNLSVTNSSSCKQPFRKQREAKLAKEKMNGKLVCGRPLVVRLASEKYLSEKADCSGKVTAESSTLSGGQMSRSAKIAAIKNKLKSLEEETHSSKKQKQMEGSSRNDNVSPD